LITTSYREEFSVAHVCRGRKLRMKVAPLLYEYNLIALNCVGWWRWEEGKSVPDLVGIAPVAAKGAANAGGGHAVGGRHFSVPA